MAQFLCEMHAHTSETSRCANVKAQSVIEEHIKAGYNGIVITDHYSTSTYERYEENELTPKERVDVFLEGYRSALEAAKGRIQVFLGMELRFDQPNDINDYLVYGVTEKFLYENTDILNMTLRDFSKLAHENKMIIFQAHPFRVGMKIVNPKYLNGVEVYNGNPRHDSSNTLAEMWANKHGLLKSSGSDYHEFEDLARGGIFFNKEISDNRELVRALLSEDYTLRKTK